MFSSFHEQMLTFNRDFLIGSEGRIGLKGEVASAPIASCALSLSHDQKQGMKERMTNKQNKYNK